MDEIYEQAFKEKQQSSSGAVRGADLIWVASPVGCPSKGGEAKKNPIRILKLGGAFVNSCELPC